MAQANYQAVINQRTCYLQLTGRLTYMISSVFDQFIEKLINECTIDRIYVDLCETEFLDSTNLGLLAKLCVYLLENHQAQACLYSPNKNVKTVLLSMGFEDIAEFGKEPDFSPGNPSQIQPDAPTQRTPAQYIYDAHATLASMNEKNELIFHDILQLFEKEKAQG